MADEKEIKMAIISGASHALAYKRKNPYASDEEVIQQVTRETRSILKKINTED